MEAAPISSRPICAAPASTRRALACDGGDKPSLVLVQGNDQVRVELAHVKAMIAAMGNAEADLAGLLAAAEVNHAQAKEGSAVRKDRCSLADWGGWIVAGLVLPAIAVLLTVLTLSGVM